ncbi:hypothetical protein B0A52_00523 [Exophiala mesophila]|uniref:Peptidase C45 hydrolase domain-containing protein n=1 Tax=Exophiala mesophila TaxID=212818 RepID=A0A438NHH3_EXOME|nr:hypothetical protein B0A52_00523 [Exophiala mesophila]
MLDISCSGTPYEIGLKHGSEAKSQVHGSLKFYESIFQTMSTMEWPEVRRQSEAFAPYIAINYPRYEQEMQGIADGAGADYTDILALNIRSEIAFSMFQDPASEPSSSTSINIDSDGCTSIGWITPNGKTFLGQNWDWKPPQMQNLIILRVTQPGTDLVPFQMITEAGIIGKIGFNANGVGCCLNAIRARGVDPQRMPIHFGLRTVLESASRENALSTLKNAGIAASAHILIGDKKSVTGLECSNIGFAELAPDGLGRICHANNFLLKHDGVDEPGWMIDSPLRAARMQQLATSDVGQNASHESIMALFKDEDNFPSAINRKMQGLSTSETLFNVVFELTERRGWVSLGRPTDVLERVELEF